MQAEFVDHIKFGILSPEQIRKLSVAKLTVPDTYNEDGYPIDGGLLDQRLGVTDPGLICKTCGARVKVCPGHFGHIELVRPVVHSEFSKFIYMLLQSTCQSCHRILLSGEQIDDLKEHIRKEVVVEDEEATAANERQIEENNSGATHGTKLEVEQGLYKKLKGIKKCPHCGAVQEKVKFERPTYFYIGDKRIKPDELRDMLSKISDDDLRLLGIDPTTSRPEWLVLSALLVPPVNVRPSITLESGERSEDDLTHKLVDIMRINQRLEQNINAGAPQIIIDDLWELLQYNVTTYFNNETAGIPPARHRSGRALKTLAQRLKGKEGRFRYNLSGKRVNYSARTVISVDPYIDVDEVGVPVEIAKKLTVPFYVTAWNINEAKELLKRTEYPMALNVISKDGKRKRIADANREEIIAALQVGDIIERQIVDGDIAIFNRQPSLHRISMMGHRVKITKGKTFRVNFAATTPYNADFDGDEMNLHIPQSLEAQAEARYLMEVQDQVFSPRDGEPIITTGEDGVTGAYLLTMEDTKLTEDEASYLLGLAGVYELPKPDSKGMYSGRDVLSMLFPKDLNAEIKTRQGVVKIHNGRITEGVISKEFFGRANKLYTIISAEYGNDVLKDFISRSSKISFAYLTLFGLSMGVKDYKIAEEMADERKKLINDTFDKVSKLIEQYKSKKLEPLVGYTLKESLERFIIAELDRARSQAGTMILQHLGPTNNAGLITGRAGAKGSTLNIVQTSIFLGQQSTLTGGRIKRGYYSKRVLPLITPGDISPSARGFIKANYYIGLGPIDLFMHAIGSRGSEVYKALLTAKSGYLQRRLINALQDYYVEEDLSVRDVHNRLVQTLYGGDGLDAINVGLAKLEE